MANIWISRFQTNIHPWMKGERGKNMKMEDDEEEEDNISSLKVIFSQDQGE